MFAGIGDYRSLSAAWRALLIELHDDGRRRLTDDTVTPDHWLIAWSSLNHQSLFGNQALLRAICDGLVRDSRFEGHLIPVLLELELLNSRLDVVVARLSRAQETGIIPSPGEFQNIRNTLFEAVYAIAAIATVASDAVREVEEQTDAAVPSVG